MPRQFAARASAAGIRLSRQRRAPGTAAASAWPLVLAAALAFWAALAQADPLPDRFPGAAAAYLVIDDGVPLWGASVDVPLPPASLTKLATALVVSESSRPDEVVTVSASAARAKGARMGLASGTRVTAGELTAAMLIRSANDACLALAEHVAGSEARFVARMNERARALGLDPATRFVNACGFDAPGHRASARDLATLAQRVVATPELARWTRLPGHRAHDLSGRAYALRSTNVLIGLVPGLLGVKTGYTNRAGHCLVAYAERGAHSVMVVLLGGGDRWWDAVAMIEQAFERHGLSPAPDAPAPPRRG